MGQNYLQPGLLVVGNLKMRGCTSYQISNRRTVQVEGTQSAEDWETRKTVANVEEQQLLAAKRAQLSRRIAALGTYLTGVGYLVPREREQFAEETLAEIREEIRVFNQSVLTVELSGYFATFKVAGDNEAIAGALYGQAVEILEEMSAALQTGSVSALRRACDKVGNMPDVFPTSVGSKLNDEVERLRARASRAVRQAKEAAEVTGRNREELEAELLRGTEVDALRMSLVDTRTEIDVSMGLALGAPREIETLSPAPEPPAPEPEPTRREIASEPAALIASESAALGAPRQLSLF